MATLQTPKQGSDPLPCRAYTTRFSRLTPAQRESSKDNILLQTEGIV